MSRPEPLTLDVRDILRNGGEPFGEIMRAVGSLAPGQALRLLATFRPVPLFGVMDARGFGNDARQLDGGDWEVTFTPRGAAQSPAEPAAPAADAPAVAATAGQVMDNRGLPPPEPMLRTLEAVENLPNGGVLEVLVDREPLILYSELKTRGHGFQATREASDCFRVVIQRKAG